MSLQSATSVPNASPNPADDLAGLTATMADVEKMGVPAAEKVEVVVAHDEGATLRVGRRDRGHRHQLKDHDSVRAYGRGVVCHAALPSLC